MGIYRKFVATSSDCKESVDCYRFEQAKKFALTWCLTQASGKVEQRLDGDGVPVTVSVEEVFVDDFGNEVDAAGKVTKPNPNAYSFDRNKGGFMPVNPGEKPRGKEIFGAQFGSKATGWSLVPLTATDLIAKAQADADAAAASAKAKVAQLTALKAKANAEAKAKADAEAESKAKETK